MSYYAGSTVSFDFILNKSTAIEEATNIFPYLSVKYPYYVSNKLLGYKSITGPVKNINSTAKFDLTTGNNSSCVWRSSAVKFNDIGDTTFNIVNLKATKFDEDTTGSINGKITFSSAVSNMIYFTGLWELELLIQGSTGTNEDFSGELSSDVGYEIVSVGKIYLNVSDNPPSAKTYSTIPPGLILQV